MKKQRFLRPPGVWAECREKIRHLRLRGAVEAYADGELTGPERARMAAHLACCWACSGSLQILQLIKTSMRSSPERAPASLAAVRLHRYVHRLAGTPVTGSGHPVPDSGRGKKMKRGRTERAPWT